MLMALCGSRGRFFSLPHYPSLLICIPTSPFPSLPDSPHQHRPRRSTTSPPSLLDLLDVSCLHRYQSDLCKLHHHLGVQPLNCLPQLLGEGAAVRPWPLALPLGSPFFLRFLSSLRPFASCVLPLFPRAHAHHS